MTVLNRTSRRPFLMEWGQRKSCNKWISILGDNNTFSSDVLYTEKNWKKFREYVFAKKEDGEKMRAKCLFIKITFPEEWNFNGREWRKVLWKLLISFFHTFPLSEAKTNIYFSNVKFNSFSDPKKYMLHHIFFCNFENWFEMMNGNLFNSER